MALVENLVDNFDDNSIDTTLWPNSFGTIEETGGQAAITAESTYSAYHSGGEWQLADSSVFCELIVPDPGGVDTEFTFAYENSAVDGELVNFYLNVYTGELRPQQAVNYWEDGGPVYTYDPVEHRWLRLRESNGTTYWDTSPDGVTWTNLRNAGTVTWVAESTTSPVYLQGYRPSGSRVFNVDNVNVTSGTNYQAGIVSDSTGVVASYSTAISYVGAGTRSLVANSATSPGLPSGLQDGDLLILFDGVVSWSATANTPGTPAGWTQKASSTHPNNTDRLTWMWAKYVSGMSAPSVSYSGSTDDVHYSGIFAFRGAEADSDPTDVLGLASSNPDAADIGPVSGVTTTASGGAVLVAGVREQDWDFVDTLSGDGLTWTEIEQIADYQLGDNIGVVLDYALTSPVTVTDKTFNVTTGNAQEATGQMWALKPGSTKHSRTRRDDAGVSDDSAAYGHSYVVNNSDHAGCTDGVHVAHHDTTTTPPSIREFAANFETYSTSTDAVTVTTSTAVKADDLLVAIAFDDYGELTGLGPISPGTWTEWSNANSGSNSSHMRTWTRTAGADGSISVTVETSASAAVHLGLYVVSGVDPAAPVIDAGGNAGNSTSLVAPSVSGEVDSLLLCGWSTGDADGETNHTPPASMVDDGETDESTYSTASWAHEALTATEPTGTRTATAASGSNYTASSVTIRGTETTDVNHQLVATERTGLTDSATVTVTEVAIERITTDPAGSADIAIAASNHARVSTDPAGVVDTSKVSSDHTRAVTDSAGATDTEARSVNFVRSQQDVVGSTDTASVSAGTFVARTDSAGSADTAATSSDHRRTVTDAVGAFDTATAVLRIERGTTDNAGATDTAVATSAFSRTEGDSAGSTDSASTTSSYIRTNPDDGGITDSATDGVTFTRATPDSAGSADSSSFTFAQTVYRTNLDSTGVVDTESAASTHHRLTTDGAGSTDIASYTVKFFGSQRLELSVTYEGRVDLLVEDIPARQSLAVHQLDLSVGDIESLGTLVGSDSLSLDTEYDRSGCIIETMPRLGVSVAL